MSYLKYRLSITQTVGGEKSVTEVEAIGRTVDGALILKYDFDGAENRLFLGKDRIVQRRTGEIRLHLIFIEGELTQSRISDGANDGMFETFTHKLTVEINGGDCSAHCEYSFGRDGEIISIDVSAAVCG